MNSLKELKQKITTSPFYLTHHHLIVPGIVLITSLLILVLVTIPQLIKLFETFKNIEELNRQKSFYQTKNTALEAINADLYRKNLETALMALPADKDIPGVTGELLVALSASSLTLNGINFSNSPPESTQVQEYTIQLEVGGPEASLRNFLERVKASPRILKLTTLDISKSRGDALSASLSLVTLYQLLPENIGNADAPVPVISEADKKTLAEIETKAASIPRAGPQPDGAQPVPGKLNPFAR